MKKLLVILFIINSLLSFSQEKRVFYYNDTGSDTLTLMNNFFHSIGSVGLAKSLIDSGVYSKSGDTLFLKRLTKTLINNYDLVDNTQKIDTFIVIDNQTIAFINFNNYGLYKLIKVYNGTDLKYEAHYSYIDTLLSDAIIKGEYYKGIYINNYPVKNGKEVFYDEGKEIKKVDWIKGRKIK